MLEGQSGSDQLDAVYAYDVKLGEKRRRQRQNKKMNKKMKGLEPDAKSLAGFVQGPNKTPDDSNLTRHEDFVVSPDTSEVDPQKNDGTANDNSTPLIIEAQTGNGSKVVEGYYNGERDNTCFRSNGGINGCNYVYRTEAEDYKMIAELGMCPQSSAMISPDARTKNAKKMAIGPVGLNITPEDKGSTHFINAAFPDTSEAQSGDCSKVVEEYKNGEKTNKGVRSDGGINRGNYVYRTKAVEYKMIAELSMSTQLSAIVASEARMKKSVTENEKGLEKTQQLTTYPTVACVADEQEGHFSKALETTEEINTNDSLRSAIVINPGLSISEGREETACLENTRGNPEVKQIEVPVRAEEKVFERRDCRDIAAEIVEHGDSTKAAENAPSLKFGSMKKKRKPRYYDFPDSNLQMCNICGEDDHKAAECTMVRRKKPCYLCGEFSHTAKRCSQRRECFKCGGRAHLARDCLEEPQGSKIIDFCLRCGDLGHHMFICQNEYSSEDLKHIQCYVCKDFGHLCCESFKYKGQTVASCYNCGQSGHLGSDCTPAKSFYNHEVKDHFAGNNGEYNKARQCMYESTTAERSFSDKEILPNFTHAPRHSGQGLPSNQGQGQMQE